MRAGVHVHMCTCVHVRMRTCVHAYLRTCVHVYTRTCVHSQGVLLYIIACWRVWVALGVILFDV